MASLQYANNGLGARHDPHVGRSPNVRGGKMIDARRDDVSVQACTSFSARQNARIASVCVTYVLLSRLRGAPTPMFRLV
jgi:hypothetical protein